MQGMIAAHFEVVGPFGARTESGGVVRGRRRILEIQLRDRHLLNVRRREQTPIVRVEDV